MGSRGPRPLPANVHKLRGNPSHKPLAGLLDQTVRPDVAVPSCPAFLGAEGRKEWRRIAAHLEKLGLVSHIDRAMLTAYCEAWDTLAWAKARQREINKTDPTGEAGRIGTTPSGYRQVSEIQQIINRSLEQIRAFAAEFGMSPSSRGRVTASDPQLGLPGVEPVPAEGGWGQFTQ